MAYYGSATEIRTDFLSGGVRKGHPQYIGEDKVPDSLIDNGRRYAYNYINSILEPSFASKIPYASGSEPEILKRLADIIAAWWIQNKRLQHLQSLEANPLNTEYAEAVKRLEKMAETGKGLGEDTPDATTAYFTHNGITPIFDMDDITSKGVDADLESRIADDRV